MTRRGPGTAPPLDTLRSPQWGATLFVWGVWAAMLLAGLYFVKTYGHNPPEWPSVSQQTGAERYEPPSLGSESDEHRIFLPQAIFLGLAKLTGCGLRTGLIFNVLTLGVAAVLLIGAMRRLRGWTSYTDAFFPVALLHLGQWENFLQSFGVQFVSSTLLASILLATILGSGPQPSLKAALLAGVCLVFLPLCGTNGAALVPALALWLVMGGLLHCFSSADPHSRRNGLAIIAVALAAVLLAIVYFVEYVKWDAEFHRAHSGARETLKTAMQFLTMSFGQPGPSYRAYSGWAIVGLASISVAVLVGVWVRHPAERVRALGLFLYLGAVASLALSVGWGRAVLGADAGFASRYVTLATAALCCVYGIWGLRPGALGQFGQNLLFTVVCLFLPMNVEDGLAGGRQAGAAASPAGSDYEGMLDTADSAELSGWAWDKNRPDEAVTVEIYDGDARLAEFAANQSRPDLIELGKGNGNHGFTYRLTAKLRDGWAHVFRVRVAGTTFDLNGSPKELVLKAP
jgi:hypothetical protein